MRRPALTNILQIFLKDEAISGKLILAATVLALVAVNSPLRELYETVWQTKLSLGLGDVALSLDLRHWINEGLMAFFFLVVGLEIKRELVHGELRDRSKAVLPIAAAVGGMVVPALFYLLVNRQAGLVQGWGIPIATDIAFAVAVLSLLSRRVPAALKIFLLTLAIVDDIGAIFVIALFYAEIINYYFLTASAVLLIVLAVFRNRIARRLSVYMLFGIVLWLTTHESGIHASIVGAALGLLAPTRRRGTAVPLAQRMEHLFLPVSTFVVLPLFAFANAGVLLTADIFNAKGAQSVIGGIVLGLVAGKILGIVVASWLMVRFGGASLPSGANWLHIVGLGFVAGIGFTVSIFITELAFTDNARLIEAAKIGIFIASILSAALGVLTLLRASRKITLQ